MAEAIGVVSGVITFIDAGKKVLDLCTRIKDAPEKIAAYQQHLEDALFNVENLKQRLQSNTNPNISIARKDLDFVDNLLIRCTEHLLALQQTLGYLDNEFKGGRRRHAWASLVAVRRSGEILGIFSKLQNGLNSLKSFLIQQNFWMLQGQSSAVAAVQTSLADLKAIQSQNMQDLEQGFATTSQRSAEYVVQELNRMLQSQTSEIIPKLDAIYAVSAKRVQMDAASQISAPTQAVSQGHPLSINGVRSRRCTCKTRPVPTYRSLGALYYQDRTKNVHESTCPLRRKSAREVSLGLKITIPALFSKVVQFVVSADFGGGGISISPAIKFPATIVDRTESEGFRLLDSLVLEYKDNYRKVYDTPKSQEMERRALSHALESFCESVATYLFPLLENGSVSAHDQDVDGETLLWVFFNAVIWVNRNGHLRPPQSEHVCKVIGMMINHFEADGNAILRSRTIMDATVDGSDYWTLRGGKASPHLGERLLQYGCEPYAFTAPSSSRVKWYDYQTTFWSFQSPELAFDFGFPEHYQAIFNRSLGRLNTFIRKGTDWDKDEPGIPPAICACAFGWSEGLRRLLQVGVNPAPLFSPSRIWCEDAIPIFISEKCPPFPQPLPGSRQSLLTEVSILKHLKFVTPDNRRLILDYVVESRRQLGVWGLQYLPHKSPERSHIEMIQDQGCLLDEFALSVWEALKAQLVSIPEYIFPGNRPSVYFWVQNELRDKSTSRAICEFLFDSGFTNVNIRDEDGCTAFWNACCKSDCSFTDFLASKGAEIHPDAHRVYIGNIERNFYYITRLPDWLFDLEPQITRDGCRCPCSSCGCTPANILAKHRPLGHTSRRILLSVYISRLRSESQEESWLEACRLEMFERLGMTHTCCEKETWDFKCTCSQVSTGPKEDEYHVKEQHLEDALETNILVYTKLRARFGGKLGDFLRAWWAAVDLFLPRDDTVDNTVPEDIQPTKKARSQGFLLPGVGRLDRIYDEFDEATIWTIIRQYFAVVDSVTDFFDGQINEVESYTSVDRIAYSDVEVALPEDLSRYLLWLNVPLSIIMWLDGSRKMARTTSFEPSRSYCYAKESCDYLDVARRKRDWIEDSIVPLVTAGVIADLSERREIPDSLYEQLERDGVVFNGQLRPLADQEDIFEQGMQFLGL